MTSQTLPKIPGLQVMTWKNADGSTSTRYRVRLQKKGHKENKVFDDLEEAKEFISLFKSKLGREKIYSMTEKEKQDYRFYQSFIESQPLSSLMNRYIKDYLTPAEDEAYSSARTKQNTKSFLNIIKSTQVSKPSVLQANHTFSQMLTSPKVELGTLKPEELSLQVIDDYIKTRREKKIKGISIERELTIFSNFLKHLKRSKQYEKLENFALQADKYLINQYKKEDNLQRQRKKAMTEDEQAQFFSILEKAQNPDIKSIVLLSLMTAMRRNEIVSLTWEQVDFEDSVIYLPTTKSGHAREVVLTKEALDFLKQIKQTKGTVSGKVFSYKNSSSFEGSYRKLQERFGVKVNFHRMRAEAFTRFFNQISGGSETMLAKFLGINNVSHFVKKHKPQESSLATEKGIINSGGHKNTQITFNHYLLDLMHKK